MNKTVLVTGAAGFIGSHMCDYLLDKGYKVIGVDNFLSGKKENVNKNIDFFEVNIAHKSGLENVFKNNKINSVIHLAAQSSVTVSVENPYVDIESNLLGTISLLELMGKYDVNTIVYSSSGGTVYGEPAIIPTPEDCKFDPISPYGITKGSAEWYIRYYAEKFNFNYTNLRFPNVFGPRQDGVGESNVIAIFINKMLKNEPLTINGDGLYYRDYTYVKDVVRAMELCLYKEGKNSYNLGTGKTTNVLTIYAILKQYIKEYTVEPIFGPEKLGDVRKVCLDTAALYRDLKWVPMYTLADAIEETLDWYKNNK